MQHIYNLFADENCGLVVFDLPRTVLKLMHDTFLQKLHFRIDEIVSQNLVSGQEL